MNRILLTTACLALSTSLTHAEDKVLTISVYGVSQDAYAKDLYRPFEAKCGCKLVVEQGNSSERLAKLEANAARPVVDVIAFSDANALDASKKGLIEALDQNRLPELAYIYDFARDPIGNGTAVGYTFYGTSIAYDSSVIDHVDSWLDLFSDKLKGLVALPNVSTTQGPLTLMMIERALGSDDMTFGKAISLIAEHRNDIVTFYEQGGQVPQLMQQGEIAAAPIGRFGWANLAKTVPSARWAAPKEGQTGGMNVLALVKGSEHADLAYQFIDYWLSAEVQQKTANDMVDSPVNKDVTVSDQVAQNITYGADMAASIHFMPVQAQAENRNLWLSQWNEKIAH